MNGVHDVGGMHCFGPVLPEADEPIFHADWERRVLAVTLATGALGRWNIDQSRAARESLPPALYLSSSYYRIWFEALERSLATTGLLEPDAAELTPARTWPEVKRLLDEGSPYLRAAPRAASFAVGERVRSRLDHPPGHTRMPRYARGQVGTVVLVHGCFVFPDRNAVALGERPDDLTPEWLYTVEFAGPDLWGEGSDPTVTVRVDAWEPYLAPHLASVPAVAS